MKVLYNKVIFNATMPSKFDYVYAVRLHLVLLYMWAIKKNYRVPCYGWGSTVSRLQSHYGGHSSLFTTQFPGVPGTNLIDLGRVKD